MKKIMNETKTRSGIKSLIWRIVGVIILAGITYFYTQKWITVGLVTIIHHTVFLAVFFFHERAWLKVKRIKSLTARSLLKMFTYETVCGNIILGTITYLITGSWKTASAITITYISFKHLCYIVNEFIWQKIKYGKR